MFKTSFVKITLLSVLLAFLLSGLILNTSDQWLHKIWKSPFQIGQNNQFQFPPDLKLKLRINSLLKLPYQYAYIYTDQDGALIADKESKSQTIALGSNMVSNIYLPPELRWTETVNNPVRNFGYPGANEISIKLLVKKIITQKKFNADTFILMTANAGLREGDPSLKGKILGTAADHTLFSEPLNKHVLLEFLYFKLSSFVDLTFESLPIVPHSGSRGDLIDSPLYEELLNLIGSVTLPKRRQEISETINLITASGARVVLLTEPFPSNLVDKWHGFDSNMSFHGKKISWKQYYPIRKKANMDLDFFKLFKKVQVIDIASCVELKADKETFWPWGELSEKGNVLFKNCFNQLFSAPP
jgi:hypothetical protein